jgi:aspartyl-tRNA(Asn)/glutamyl-tRNA(Gln) amidotransferase subunit B
LIALVDKKLISNTIAKKLLDTMLDTGQNPEEIIKEQGIELINDDTAIESLIDKVLDSNKSQVALYHSGKERLFGFFVGEVMKASKGSANPSIVSSILSKKLQQT